MQGSLLMGRLEKFPSKRKFNGSKIDDVSLINELEILDRLLETSTMVPVWKNLIYHFEANENEITRAMFLMNVSDFDLDSDDVFKLLQLE